MNNLAKKEGRFLFIRRFIRHLCGGLVRHLCGGQICGLTLSLQLSALSFKL
jgi:hypothetical protein